MRAFSKRLNPGEELKLLFCCNEFRISQGIIMFYLVSLQCNGHPSYYEHLTSNDFRLQSYVYTAADGILISPRPIGINTYRFVYPSRGYNDFSLKFATL